MELSDEVRAAFASGREEAVEVNQRGLIEKILARYSGEYTVFRELLQNADDAQASTVQVHFTSINPAASVTSLKSEPITRITVKNDGIVFREEDWRRLKTVADGQPSVESIGAFGVGFYSIWSISDEPHVVSGDQMMLFFWKGQQLAVRRAQNPHTNGSVSSNGRPFSSITMPCRSPEPMPDPATFSKFIATALPFTSHITTMSVYFNDIELCSISKTPAPSRDLRIPSNTNVRTPGKMMTLSALEVAPLQLTCRAKRITLSSLEAPAKTLAQAVKQSFASKFLSFATSSRQVEEPVVAPAATEKNPLEDLTASLFLRIVTAQAKLTASPAIVAEIERSTKKPPPSLCRLRVLYSSKEEADASRPGGIENGSIQGLFSQLTSDLKTQGKIYIGFPLFQTTGCASAISGRFIPTVEREQIDLQAKAIADYNRELLSIAGITCRIIYDDAMRDIAARWKGIKADDQVAQADLFEASSHLLQNFTFHQSTPIAEVGRLVQTSFFASNTREFLIISTQGVLPASKVRLPASELSFLTGLATVPEKVAQDASLILDQLQERNMIQTVTIDDVIGQLNAKPLPLGQAISAIQWWIGLAANLQYDPRLMPRFRDALVITIPSEVNNVDEQVIPMSSVKVYQNPKTIPPDMPVPSYMLPYAISRTIPWQDLHRVFGISELSIADWVSFLTSKDALSRPETSIVLSPTFSEKVLGILAKVWMNLRNDQSAQVTANLKILACIPTKKGMVLPSDAYLPKVTLFEDLPITTILTKGSMEKLLRSLGVRDHVDLQLVFSRLLGAGSWDQEQVAKYLVSVSNTLSSDELDKLKKTAWLTKEQIQSQGTEKETTTRTIRYKAASLYEPSDSLRSLGLPILAWSAHKWRSQSEEAKMLYKLGLRKFPAVEDILIMASDETVPERRKLALDYFLEHFEAQYASVYAPIKQNLPFVPVLRNGQLEYAKPTESYSSPGSNIMGFAVLHPDYQLHAAKFRLATDPPSSVLVKKLLNSPPGTHNDARPIFAYLAGQASNFAAAEHNALSMARLVPVQEPGTNIWRLAFPKAVYFHSTENNVPEQFRSLFTFVDYGSTANAFLLQIGVRNEPTTAEITQMLLDDPRRFLTLAGSSERYISLLRQVAAQASTFPGSLRRRMQDTPFLLGFERIRPTHSEKRAVSKPIKDDDDEEEDGLLQFRLALAVDIVVVDDTTLVNDFKEHILQCPQDDLCEAFAESLGSKRISKLVTTTYTSTTIPDDASPRAVALRKLILERTVLFLHERPQTGKDVRFDEDWLKKNLKVREVTRIERQRTLTLGPSRVVRSSPASAAATQEKGTLLLRFSASFAELDYYEVAAALTRLILAKQKIHDTLLFMTLLQTSLRDLKRRGFNVDKIMNARKAEQEVMEQKQREERAEAERRRIALGDEAKAQPPAYDDAPLPSPIQSAPLPPPSARGLFDSLKQRLRSHPHSPLPTLEAERFPGTFPGQERSIEGPPILPSKGATPGRSSEDIDVTPSSNINTNVLRAVEASRPDRSGNITSQVETKEVKESSSYCDSTPARELDYVTDVDGLRFYISRSVNADENILQEHGEALQKYVTTVIKPVGRVFNIDLKALHIFYDQAGPLIAFNRSGSIFFNFRFHLAWHGVEMKRGDPQGALISTYFSMAHELAHNLVTPHNSEHSFYTSQIAQNFFSSMAALVASYTKQPDFLM